MNGLQCNCANKLQEINFKDCGSLNIIAFRLVWLAGTKGPTFHEYYSCYIPNLRFEMDAEQMDNLLLA